MKPILQDFPESFETERLTIRAPKPSDAIEVNQAITESIDELRPWMAWATEAPTPEQTAETVRRAHGRFLLREDLMYLILLKGAETLVGCSGLHRIDWDIPSFEIGYWVRTSHAGQGYITEAVSGLTAFAFEQLGAHRVFIKCDAKNVASAAVAKRAGFEYEGLHRCETRDHFGQLRDTLYFAKVRIDDEARVTDETEVDEK